MGISRLCRRVAMSGFTVCVCVVGLVSSGGLARASVLVADNDAIASATSIDMSGDTSTFFSQVSNAGATADDDAADGQLATTDFAEHTLWYKFKPAPGLVSVSVTSSNIPSIVAGVVTTTRNDSALATPPSPVFNLVTDPSVTNTDGDPADVGSALAHTTTVNQTVTFRFSNYAHLVPDAQHDYYLGVGSVGPDSSAPTGTITIQTAHTAAPINDGFANPTVITTSVKHYIGDTTGATPDLDGSDTNIDPVVHGQSGMFSVWYKFRAPGNGRIALSTVGSSFPVVFELCQSPVATPQGCDNSDVADSGPAGTDPISTASIDAQKGETYYLFLDGQQVAGQVYNASGPYNLGFVFSRAPPNDDISTPTVLSPAGVVRVAGSNLNAQAVVLGNNPPVTTAPESSYGLIFDGGGQQHSVWYRYKPNKSAHLVLYTTGSLNTDVELFRGSLAAGFTDTGRGNDDYSATRTRSRFALPVTSGTVYYIGVDGSTAAGYPEGSFGLDLGAVPANDNLKGAQLLAKTKGKVGKKKKATVSKRSGKVKGSTDFATFQHAEKSPKTATGGADVWYTFIAPKAGSYRFTESLTHGAALLAAYSGKGASNLGLKLVKEAIHPGTTKPASITIKAKAGQKFKISVDGSIGAFGSYTLSWK